MLHGNERGKRAAARLRWEMTLPEMLLWQRLKGRPNGLKFRRQHPAGNFVLDFYCHEAKLIIEVDGIAHDMGEKPDKDRQRDAHFQPQGFRVVHIPATDVLADPDRTAESIIAAAGEAI
ncbi:MAG: endonuclease domain-containing protein [Croceibacterium sp.]